MVENALGRVALIFFLVLLNGFFVASEFAFVRVRQSRIKELIATGSKRALRLEYIIKNLNQAMSSTQVGITIASLSLGFIGEEFFKEIFVGIFDIIGLDTEILIQTPIFAFVIFLLSLFVVSYMHIVIGELAPRSASIQYAEKASLLIAEPFYWFMIITKPLLHFFVWSEHAVLKLVRIPVTEETETQVYTEEELKIIIEDSIKKGEIEEYESKLIFNVLDFTDTTVKSLLTPRIDIKALPITSSVDEILNLSVKTGHSRFPIYEEKLDDVLGFIHLKDVVPFIGDGKSHENLDLKQILRPVIVVYEGKQIDDLLKEMQEEKTQVAIIVDEYGSVEGMVTLEDIIEEIFGPIKDEFDEEIERDEIISEQEDSIEAAGMIQIESFNETLEEKFNAKIESEASVTLAGYVLELFESEIPQEGDTISDANLNYEILKLTGNRIDNIRVTPMRSDDKDSTNGE